MNIEQERATFERFMSDNGRFPEAVERNSDGSYVLMQAASSWHVWQARAAIAKAEAQS